MSFSRGFNQTSENSKLNKDDSFMKSYLSGGRDGVVFFLRGIWEGEGGCTLRERRGKFCLFEVAQLSSVLQIHKTVAARKRNIVHIFCWAGRFYSQGGVVKNLYYMGWMSSILVYVSKKPCLPVLAAHFSLSVYSHNIPSVPPTLVPSIPPFPSTVVHNPLASSGSWPEALDISHILT